MKERPILFSSEMVRAILEGRKTQTRRILKPQPTGERLAMDLWEDGIVRKCPYGEPGDRLWVRETWQKNTMPTGPEYYYRATGEEFVSPPWKSPIFMPRVASRILLEVTDVRVERLREITEDDAKLEGAICAYFDCEGKAIVADKSTKVLLGKCGTFQQGFQSIWQSIHGPESWEENHWVWVVEFKKIQP